MSRAETKRTNLSREEIINFLAFLRSKLPINPTATNVPYILPFKITDNQIYQDDLVVNLQRIADHMGYYLLVLKKVKVFYKLLYYDAQIYGKEKIFTCDSNGSIFVHDNYSDAAGHYSQLSPDVYAVTINKKKGYKVKHLIGILVHEMMHHYLSHYNIRKTNINENEILTDIASAYLGMGHLLLEAYSTIEWTSDHWKKDDQRGHTLHQTWIGYVTTETLRVAIAISTELRDLKPKDTVNSIISFSDRSILKRKLLKYRFSIFKQGLHQKMKDIRYRKYSKAKIKIDNLILKHNDLINKREYVDKINLKKVNQKDGIRIVGIMNNISTGNFENELLDIKSSLTKNEFSKTIKTMKRLDELEKKIDDGIKLFKKYLK